MDKASKSNFALWIKIFCIILLINCTSLSAFYFIYKPKIAYVDTSVLLEKYKGMIDARKVYQEHTKKWQDNIDTLQGELQGKMLDYEKNRSKMSKKELDLSMENLEHKKKDFMQYQQAINQKAKEEENKLLQGPVNQINSFVADYGKKRGYKIIFGTTGGNILYGDEAINITDQILAGINSEYGGQSKK